MQLTSVFKDEEAGKFDWHVILFLLNVFLVILGYSMRGASFQMVKLGRTGLVVISLLVLMAVPGQAKYIFSRYKDWVLWVFIIFNLYVIAFSVDFLKSIGRIAAWLPFLIYIDFFIVYLFRKYNKVQVKIKLLQIFNWAYIYPLVIMFVYANPLIMRDIYGYNIGGFKSNVLGWAAVAFFVTAADILMNAKPSRWYKRFLIGALIFAVLALLSTGSRSSYLCMALSLVILVVNSKRMGFLAKLILSLLVVGATYFMLEDPDSAINKRIEKSETQLEKGEARFEMAAIAFDVMLEHPELLFTGFGYDNFRAGIGAYTGIELDLASHNSYLELFITTGLFTFTFFLVFFVLNAIIRYILYDIRRCIFLPTFMIIPFFESNLNAGQFLFFPWMTFMFYYIHIGVAQRPLPRITPAEEPQRNPPPLGIPWWSQPQPFK